MNLAQVFRLSVYSMLTLSAIMLMISEGTPFPAVLSIPVGLIALVYTDRLGKLILSPFWTNVLALIGVGFAVSELIYGEVNENIEARIISGAHLLVYLTWVVMLQEKRFKQYWWLCALSVLQVAIGAVLTKAGWYGSLLFIYFFLAIWTLSVFSLYQASESMLSETALSAFAPAGAVDPTVATPGAEGRILASAAGTVSPLQLIRSSSASRQTIQMDLDEDWISKRFAGGTVLTALGAILIGAVFFVLIPRVWIGRPPFADDEDVDAGRTLTGFTSEVRLGAFGDILESTQQVLDVRVFDGDRELDVFTYAQQLGYEEPLFRGAVLGVYAGGRWSVGSLGGRVRQIQQRPVESAVRQEIVLEPIGTDCLFAMHPVLACDVDDQPGAARLHSASSVLFQSSTQVAKKPIVYTVYSRRRARSDEQIPQRMDDYALFVYRRLPPRGLERLRELAESLVSSEQGEREKARKIESYLRDSGEFTYTLRMERLDSSIDPVEDFLFNRREGHCEYYASALALMLRAVGIPSRLVSGFKGGIRNSVTGHFEVQQRHAHAWVEAYLDGRWVVMDATPAERDDSVQSLEPRLKTWADLKKFISDFWSSQVVDVSLQNQYRNVYQPLQASMKQWWSALRGNREDARRLWQAVREFVSSPEKWFSWQGGLVTFVLSLLVSGLVWGIRRLWRAVQRLRTALNDPAGVRQKVEFYEQFRDVCAAHGLKRRPSETYWEFAEHSRTVFRDVLESMGVLDLPQRVIEQFVAIRFGHSTVPEELQAGLLVDVRAFEQALQLRKAEQQAGRHSGTNGWPGAEAASS